MAVIAVNITLQKLHAGHLKEVDKFEKPEINTNVKNTETI